MKRTHYIKKIKILASFILILITQMIICQEKRESEELISQADLRLLNPLPPLSSPSLSEYNAFKVWAGERTNNYQPGTMDPGLPADRNGGGTNNILKNGKLSTIADDMASVDKNADSTDSTNFAIKTSEISPTYPRTFKGLDNEQLYAMAEKDKKEKLIKYGAGALLFFLLIYLFFKYFSDKFSFANKSAPNEIVKAPAPIVEIDDTLNRLQKIQHLKDNGTLTEVEFDIIKKRILNS